MNIFRFILFDNSIFHQNFINSLEINKTVPKYNNSTQLKYIKWKPFGVIKLFYKDTDIPINIPINKLVADKNRKLLDINFINKLNQSIQYLSRIK